MPKLSPQQVSAALAGFQATRRVQRQEQAPKRLIGTVKWFNAERGFGYIARDGGGPDVFVHGRAVAASRLAPLREGDRVEFTALLDTKGSRAVSLKLLVPAVATPRRGRVLYFDLHAGKGAIVAEDNGAEFAVDWAAVEASADFLSLRTGDKVAFDAAGRAAINLRRLEPIR